MRISRERGKPPENEHSAAVSIDSLRSVEEAKLALHLAEEALGSGKNIAKKKKLEFLLWLSGTRDIKNALRKTLPEDEYFLISFEEKEGGEHGLPEEGDPIRLEKISLSRI